MQSYNPEVLVEEIDKPCKNQIVRLNTIRYRLSAQGISEQKADWLNDELYQSKVVTYNGFRYYVIQDRSEIASVAICSHGKVHYMGNAGSDNKHATKVHFELSKYAKEGYQISIMHLASVPKYYGCNCQTEKKSIAV